MEVTKNIVLAGNPNSGKSTLFNILTGLKQQTGNFPGVTVNKKSGKYTFANQQFGVTDLPGAYSMYPKSLDEIVSCNYIQNITKEEVLVYVADASNLKRSLYFFSQIQDLSIPCVLVLNMMDIVARRNWTIDTEQLSTTLGCPVIELDAKNKKGFTNLKEVLLLNTEELIPKNTFYASDYKSDFIDTAKSLTDTEHSYAAFLKICNLKELLSLIHI